MKIRKVLSLAVVLAMALTAIPAFGLTAAAADNGLVARYDFTDGAKDAAGNFDGIVNGNELVFDPNGFVTYPGGSGTGTSYISLPADVIKDLNGDFTISMWVNQDSKYSGDTGSISLWDFANTTSNYDRLFTIIAGNSVTVRNRADRAPAESNGTMKNDTKDKWALVTIAFDLTGENTVKAYINGEELALKHKQIWDEERAPSEIYKASNGTPRVWLGHSAWATNSKEAPNNPDFKGGMADVRIYNKALTADEVKALFDVHKTVKVTYMAGDKELKSADTYDYFTEQATFTVPTVIKEGEKVYALQNVDLGDNADVEIKTSETEYKAEYKDVTPKATGFTVNDITFIDGNDPVLPKTLTVETDIPGVTYEADVDWGTNTFELGENTVTGKVEGYDELASPTIKVTKLRCDDALADEIKTGGQGTNAAHTFSPVKGKVSFEFDLTYNIDGIVGNNGVFIGYFDGKTVPRYDGSGNAIGIQGMNDSDKGNVGLRDGEVSVKTFAPVKGETYRIFVTTNTAANPAEAADDDDSGTYTLIARDSTGKLVYQTEKNLAYRTNKGKRACGEILNALVVSNNNGDIKELNQFVDDTVVKNFRIAWAEGYTEYTVKAQCDGKDIEGFESYTKKFIDNTYITAPIIENYELVGEPVIDGNTVTYNYKKKAFATNMFSYRVLEGSNGKVDGTTYRVGPLDWSNVGIVTMEFAAPEIPEGQVFASARFNIYATKINSPNDPTPYRVKIYSIDPEKADFADSALLGEGYTEQNWTELTGAVELYNAAAKYSADKAGYIGFDVDMRNAVIKEGKIVLGFVVTEHEMTVANTSYEDGAYKPYLVNEQIVTPPEVPALTAALGWNEGAFTIDYTAGDVAVVENAVYGATVVSSDGKTMSGTYDPGENGGIGLATPNTNLTYVATPTVTYAGAVFEGEPTEKDAIYSLVMTALKKAIDNKTITGEISADQLAAVNTVLANGGIFIDDKGELTAEAKMVMTKTGSTITLNEGAVALGLKFSVDKDAVTYAVKDGEGNVTTPVDAITVTETTITINDAAAAEAVMLALEAVNLEFVPTEVADSVAEDADAAQDFIPEL